MNRTAAIRTVAPGGGIPTGTVTVHQDGADLAAAVPLNASGRYLFGLRGTALRTSTITVTHGGDPTHGASTSADLIIPLP